MKRILSYSAVIIGLGLSAPTAFAQTTANGPYYATPSWDQTLPASTRFIVLSNMNSEAVLDRETGLVWQRSPSTTMFDFFHATEHCMLLVVGNRSGWRLPRVQELLSLLDGSAGLPSGHPFLNIQSDFYWSATLGATGGADLPYLVDVLGGGTVGSNLGSVSGKSWCVRGGQGTDIQIGR